MSQACKNQVSLIDTPYYHCASSWLRRSFFMWCGSRAADNYSGRTFEHRRA